LGSGSSANTETLIVVAVVRVVVVAISGAEVPQIVVVKGTAAHNTLLLRSIPLFLAENNV
jgi:hypothetical protein